MKRSTFSSVSSLAIIFAASNASARDTVSVVSQTGLGQFAELIQSRAFDSEISLTQSGEANEGRIAQVGDDNRAVVAQSAIASGATAIVGQLGDGIGIGLANDVSIGQSGRSAAVVLQTGAGNLTGVVQRGDDATAAIFQNNDAGAAIGVNAAAVAQDADGAFIVLRQDGAGASASINQSITATGADAIVTQIGVSDSVTINRDKDTALVCQNFQIPSNGNGNYGGNDSTVSQGAGANSASVNQDGLDGTSFVTQSNGGNATVDQNGNNQTSTIDQSDSATADVVQSGDNNGSLVRQDGASTAAVDQDGNRNNSDLFQFVDGATAEVDQRGNDNRSKIEQS